MVYGQVLVLVSLLAAASAGFAGNAAEYHAQNKGIASSISNVISKVPGLIQSPSASPCTPESQIPLNLTALQNILPPSMAKVVTPENLKAIQNVGRLATLATGAATGNPIAIIDLIVFLASPENPIVPLYNLGKEIVPHLSPAELAAHLPSKETITGTVHNATESVVDQFQELQSGLQSVFNGLKPSKPAAPVPEPASNVTAPAA